jgi:hypothetical protein
LVRVGSVCGSGSSSVSSSLALAGTLSVSSFASKVFELRWLLLLSVSCVSLVARPGAGRRGRDASSDCIAAAAIAMWLGMGGRAAGGGGPGCGGAWSCRSVASVGALRFGFGTSSASARGVVTSSPCDTERVWCMTGAAPVAAPLGGGGAS